MEWINQALLTVAFVDILVDIGINVDMKLDCKTVRILRIQVRANSQTKGLERGWKQRARLLGRFARVRPLRYAKPILKKTRLFCSPFKRHEFLQIHARGLKLGIYAGNKDLSSTWKFSTENYMS